MGYLLEYSMDSSLRKSEKLVYYYLMEVYYFLREMRVKCQAVDEKMESY